MRKNMQILIKSLKAVELPSLALALTLQSPGKCAGTRDLAHCSLLTDLISTPTQT